MKMKRILMLFLVFTLLLGACAKLPAAAAYGHSGIRTAYALVLALTQAPDVESEAKDYLELWKSEDYEGMYARLSKLTRDALTLEDFTKEHKKRGRRHDDAGDELQHSFQYGKTFHGTGSL